MAEWLRTTVVLSVLIVWAAYVITQLATGQPIDAVVWGIPGGFLLLLGPHLKGGGGNGAK